MDRAHDVGAGDVEDLVAALVALEVVERQVVLLQHRAHRAVRDDDALGKRLAQGRRLSGHDAPHRCGGAGTTSGRTMPR